MTFIGSILLHIGVLFTGVTGVFISHKYFKAKDDNAFEQLVEMQLKRQTGMDIDLSPESPEKKVVSDFKKKIDRQARNVPVASRKKDKGKPKSNLFYINSRLRKLDAHTAMVSK